VGALDTAALLRRRNHPVVGPLARRALRTVNRVDVPREVVIGDGLVVHHQGVGLVVHDRTRIGDRVHLFHGVTIGRADVWRPQWQSQFEGVVVEDDVWLCAGAVVLGGPGTTTVGRGTVVGANAVLLGSTGEWEIWAGAPARLIGHRDPGSALLPRRLPDVAA
jgi:serine O-acetyltransferase